MRTLKIDGRVGDIFELQDRIVFDLSRSLNVKLGKAEADAIERDETTSVEAFEAYSRGVLNLRSAGRDAIDRAIALFERAVGARSPLRGGVGGARWRVHLEGRVPRHAANCRARRSSRCGGRSRSTRCWPAPTCGWAARWPAGEARRRPGVAASCDRDRARQRRRASDAGARVLAVEGHGARRHRGAARGAGAQSRGRIHISAAVDARGAQRQPRRGRGVRAAGDRAAGAGHVGHRRVC